MSLFQTYNNENILSRAVSAGLLNILNNQLEYEQVWSNEEVEIVKVPFYYDWAHDQRLMQDFFTFYAWCLPPRPVDGNFDALPRGHISYKGSTINQERITSRFVQGRYLKEVNGKLESYVSFLYSIPLTLNYDIEIKIDNHTTSLKLEQLLREMFYKTITFYVYYKGMRLGCQVGFPESYNIEKLVKLSFDPENKITIKFSLEVETYQPVFDKTTEQKASNTIKAISYRLHPTSEQYDGNIFITSPQENIIIPKGIPLSVEWLTNKEESIINKVNITYTEFNKNKRYTIDTLVNNHELYIWNIPDDFTSYIQPECFWEDTSTAKTVKQPIIKIIPDLNTKQINASSFFVLDPGFFTTTTDDASIGLTLEMKDKDGKIVYTPNNSIFLNIKFNKLNHVNLISSIDPSIFYPNDVNYKHINLYVSNANNNDHFGITHGLKIV